VSKPRPALRQKSTCDILKELQLLVSGRELSSEEKAGVREASIQNDFAAKSNGYKIPRAILERLNCDLQAQQRQSTVVDGPVFLNANQAGPSTIVYGPVFLEVVLPHGSNKYRLGNFVVTTIRPKRNESLANKKKRFAADSQFPLTTEIAEWEEWVQETLEDNHKSILNAADTLWELQEEGDGSCYQGALAAADAETLDAVAVGAHASV